MKNIFLRVLLYVYFIELSSNFIIQHQFRLQKYRSENANIVLPFGPEYEPIRQVLEEAKSKYSNFPLTTNKNYDIIIMWKEFEAIETLGQAHPGRYFCVIQISTSIQEPALTETIIHELLHCYGYRHTHDVFDIMNPYIGGFNYDKSIQRYFTDMREKNEYYTR